MTEILAPVEGVVNVIDANERLTGDTMMAWFHGSAHGWTPRRGFDLKIGTHRVQVSATLKRKKLRVFVDGREWKAV